LTVRSYGRGVGEGTGVSVGGTAVGGGVGGAVGVAGDPHALKRNAAIKKTVANLVFISFSFDEKPNRISTLPVTVLNF
jgi:hypothetical protein